MAALSHEVLRTTYYTYATGSEDKIDEIRDEIRNLKIRRHMASSMPNTVTPCVFRKRNRERSGKGVDIQMCVDILGHAYRGNTDTVLIMSGDGDFVPLIEEVKRAGVQVYLSAFSDGLNPELVRRVNSFHLLDGSTWQEAPATENRRD